MVVTQVIMYTVLFKVSLRT